MNTSVIPEHPEFWFGAEIQILRMLEDKPAVFCQQIMFFDQSGQRINPGHVVGRIGKYQVVLIRRVFDKGKHVCFPCLHLVKSHLSQHAFDKTVMIVVFFYQIDLWTTSRGKFIGDASCTGKQVEHPDRLQVEIIDQDVKQTFPGNIGSGSCPERFVGMNNPALMCAADYAQLYKLNKVVKR